MNLLPKGYRPRGQAASVMRHTCFACGLRFIFCPLQLCHFEGALGSCFTLSLSLAPVCCTERIDFFPLVEPIKRSFV